ncbi:hypothetical protein C8J26_3976 [Sphingomonas aurantiaca]|uniref:Uncharacterized protein n=1 Tax=Sphingomonas aurantiaca TaxID=185949 RepID=A0A2T5GFV0_9SPHN|nr:hypothetical protein [Sphingomonas aurantiaca]PTQ58206.1 hypothetical protein C8J26_3976 [Sphingomonas aurantiaca]
MSLKNILVGFTDGSAMVYQPKSSVRIANRGPSPVRKKDFEQVRQYPPEWVGFGSFYAEILAAGQRVETHRGLLTVDTVKHDVDLPQGDHTPSSIGNVDRHRLR